VLSLPENIIMKSGLVRTPRIDQKFACFAMEIRPSAIHRYGVYAQERIPANRKVMETSRRGQGKHTYLFTLDSYWTLDGSVGGSGAEIINHCCEPNLVTRIIKGHILYVSLKEIKKGDELTVDYHFDHNTDNTPCACGAKDCRGTMEKPKEKKAKKKK
jgi:SET domain-containing protein